MSAHATRTPRPIRSALESAEVRISRRRAQSGFNSILVRRYGGFALIPQRVSKPTRPKPARRYESKRHRARDNLPVAYKAGDAWGRGRKRNQMTQDRKLKQAVRNRMAESGEPYMEARRQLLDKETDAGPEPHYVLSRVRGVERVESDRRRLIDRRNEAGWMVEERGAWWGYGGSGPITTAKVLLDDALEIDADQMESRVFCWEVLARLEVDLSEERLTVTEIRAWWAERRNIAVEQARSKQRHYSPEDQARLIESFLDGDPDPGLLWLSRRRELHPPRFS